MNNEASVWLGQKILMGEEVKTKQIWSRYVLEVFRNRLGEGRVAS